MTIIHTMTEYLALITILVWPLIPLFWIPVHLFPRFFRKVRYISYLLPFLTWLPAAYILYRNRSLLMDAEIQLPLLVNIAGLLLLVAGTLLHIWTIRLLGLKGIIGLPEVNENIKGRVVREGAFTVVRHPTYLAHTLMFSGVFLLTGVIAVGLIALIDFVVVYTVIIPFEEKELLGRLGKGYERYRNDVPKLLPRLRRK